ncbi:MAG TPA: GTPase HflX [Thermoanaerobaculia bacterium]
MPENAVTVGLILPELTRSVAEEHLEELAKLVESAGGSVVASVIAKRPAPDPATYIGSGKAEEIKKIAGENGATLVVFDDDLSPAQVRNLEKITGVKVIDRSALILDIFASRARSREARTQVELAQLELDRRIVRTRISRLKDELKKIEQHRHTQRKARQQAFTVALVGYTNAGKSTLFNRLTQGHVEAVDKLFATLDAKSARIDAEMPRETVIVDTVGFIRKLPHHLVASFRSTMEEAVAADLVLHVIDQSHPLFEEQRTIGDEVLRDLGVDMANVIEVYNKADRVEDHFHPHRKNCVSVSALTGRGIEKLTEEIRRRELEGGEMMQLAIPHGESRVAARLHEVAEVYEQSENGEATLFAAWVPKGNVREFAGYRVRMRARRTG